jgi:hypothetical protein
MRTTFLSPLGDFLGWNALARTPKFNPLSVHWSDLSQHLESGVNEAIREMLPLGHKTAASGKQN